MPNQNQGELAGGTAFHQRHGRLVFRASLLRSAGMLLILVSLLLLAVGVTLGLLG